MPDIELIDSIDVRGRKKPGVDGEEVLTDISVRGRTKGSNGPVDGERLEGIDVIGKSRKKSDPKHLYYPNSLGDSSGPHKNAIRFIAYAQTRSFQDDPGDTSPVRNLPDQFESAGRTFPVSFGAFATTFGFKNALIGNIPKVGNVGAVLEDIYGIAKTGLEYFATGERTNYGRRTKQLDSSITLYMPDTMVNQDKHDYQPISINQASGRAGLFTQGLPEAMGGLGSPLGRLETFAELAGRSGIFGTRATEAVLAGLGYALNPMLEMTYGGTQPRTFLFQFRFAPKNYKEAEDVLKIIKTFRFHAHSENTGGDADVITAGSGTRYVIPPNHFEIEFIRRVNGKFEENLAMPRISTCMLASINTNYAAQIDSFATFRDGTPVSISLDLEFVESVVLSKNDIKKGY